MRNMLGTLMSMYIYQVTMIRIYILKNIGIIRFSLSLLFYFVFIILSSDILPLLCTLLGEYSVHMDISSLLNPSPNIDPSVPAGGSPQPSGPSNTGVLAAGSQAAANSNDTPAEGSSNDTPALGSSSKTPIIVPDTTPDGGPELSYQEKIWLRDTLWAGENSRSFEELEIGKDYIAKFKNSILSESPGTQLAKRVKSIKSINSLSHNLRNTGGIMTWLKTSINNSKENK